MNEQRFNGADDAGLSRPKLELLFVVSAVILTPASIFVVFAYAGPEPFAQYQRADAFFHIGVSTSFVTLWIVWSLGVLGLVIAGVFSAHWLGGLLLAAIAIFYLTTCPSGYLDDLENFMLSPEQQQRIELPKHKS